MNSILQFKGWLLPGCINFNAGRAGRPLTIVWLFCEVKSCQAPALSTDVFYANCAAARAAGKAPLLRGQPDYRGLHHLALHTRGPAGVLLETLLHFHLSNAEPLHWNRRLDGLADWFRQFGRWDRRLRFLLELHTSV